MLMLPQTFNPKYRDEEMRSKLTDGNPKDPLIIYVGRMGSEKRLRDLRGVLGRCDVCRSPPPILLFLYSIKNTRTLSSYCNCFGALFLVLYFV